MSDLTNASFKEKLHQIIFEADTPMGKFFDILLLVFMMLNVLVVLIDGANSLNNKLPDVF